MYNAEKYISDCLNSILNQSFRNFEVIVVNDCSTDNSAAIVQSYVEKFDGRLIPLSLEENSGHASTPRNKGLRFSRGEYIFFMDADDLLIDNSLGDVCALARKFAADAVLCEKYYDADDNLDNRKLIRFNKSVAVNEPTFEPEDLSQRVQGIFGRRYGVTTWTKLVKRDLLIKHEIIFPNVIRDDEIWTWNLVLLAKRFLRVPNAMYIRRFSRGSTTRQARTPAQAINFWLNSVILGVKHCEKFMNGVEFLRKNPPVYYALLDHFIELSFAAMLRPSAKMPPFKLYTTIKEHFGKSLGEYDTLVAALCTALNTQQKNLLMSQQNFEQFSARIQQQSEKFKQMLTRAKDRINELEKICRDKDEYISELENLIASSQK